MRNRSLALGLVALVLAGSLSASVSSADDAGAVAPACVESIPKGIAKPELIQKAPSRAKAGELVELSILVRHSAGETATLPADLPNLIGKGDVRIADEGSFGGGKPPESLPDPGDPRRATTLLKVPFVVLSTAIQRKSFELPAVRVIVLRSGGGDIHVCTTAHKVDVDQPIASSPDPKVRPNPTSLVQITRNEQLQKIVFWSVVALVVGVFLALLFVWMRRRPKVAPPPPPPPAPWTRALAAISHARASFAAGSLDNKGYYDSLSDAIRDYLGHMYGFDGLESTTDEIAARLKRIPSPALPVTDVLAFLGACDLVKFARQDASTEQGNAAADAATSIVRATSPLGGVYGAASLRPFQVGHKNDAKPSRRP